MLFEYVQILATAVIIILILGIAFYVVITRLYKELKRKETEAIEMILETQERERSAISREVHDNLGPTLSITQMQIGYLMEQTTDEKTLELLSNIQKQMHQSIHLCRDISHMISPEMNREKDLRLTLEEQIALINQVGKVEVKLEMYADHVSWDPGKGTSVVRIIQELMTNTLKHAHADKVIISVRVVESYIQLQFSDNGRSFHADKIKHGMGIQNITKRISILGGKMTWNDPRVSSGMNLTALIPIQNIVYK
jgi:signal transduction histidine kinase